MPEASICKHCHTRIVYDEVNEVWRSRYFSRFCAGDDPQQKHEPGGAA